MQGGETSFQLTCLARAVGVDCKETVRQNDCSEIEVAKQ